MASLFYQSANLFLKWICLCQRALYLSLRELEFGGSARIGSKCPSKKTIGGPCRKASGSYRLSAEAWLLSCGTPRAVSWPQDASPRGEVVVIKLEVWSSFTLPVFPFIPGVPWLSCSELLLRAGRCWRKMRKDKSDTRRRKNTTITRVNLGLRLHL